MKMNRRFSAFTLLLFLSLLATLERGSAQEQCGWQAGGALCPLGLCCSHWGFCGTTEPYCGGGCQSQCPTPPPPPPSPPPPPPPSPPPPSPPPPSPPPPSPPPPSPPPPSPPPPPTAQCGWQAGGAICPGRLCCSSSGYCGVTEPFCGRGCQSNCHFPPQCIPGGICGGRLCCNQWGYCVSFCGPRDISDVINSTIFEQMIQSSTSSFYTYDAFITAAKFFSAFATTGDIDTRKREIAAFFAQTAMGCAVDFAAPGTADLCIPNVRGPCVPGKQYISRGPIQISYNYTYVLAGEAIGVDLLNNPDLVETDPVISFKIALWFWMTPQSPIIPSSHDVITGKWLPSVADLDACRVPGYGVITNIIAGNRECGRGSPKFLSHDCRIGFYTRNCELLGVSPGDNIDCYFQSPFGTEQQLLLLDA